MASSEVKAAGRGPPGALHMAGDNDAATDASTPSPQRESLRALPLEERLLLAQQRREEFRSWVCAKAKSKKVQRTDDSTKTRLQKLKERQKAAEQARDRLLEEVRQKAAVVDARREVALRRISQRQDELAQKVAQSLSAAEERRNALLEAERERLRAEHSLVLTRLALSKDQESAPGAEAARRRLEERLALAEEQRQQRLAQAAARAGSKFEHAKAVSALTKQLAKQQALEKLEHLQAKLESAEARRLANRTPTPLSPTGAAAHRPPRVSVGGSICITSPPLTAESSRVEGDDPAECLPRTPTPPPKATALTAQVSTQLLQEVEGIMQRAHSMPMPPEPSTDNTGAADASVTPLDGERAARLEALRRSASTRRLQAAWRQFTRKHRTTAALAQAFADRGVMQLGPASRRPSEPNSPAPAPAAPAAPAPVVIGVASPFQQSSLRGAGEFDAFARVVQAPATLRAASALLRRLESRLTLRNHSNNPAPAATGAAEHGAGKVHGHGVHVHHHQHHHRGKAGSTSATGGASERNVTRILRRLYPDLPKDRVPDRYPPRILLCSLMIIHHPEVVFNGTGDREAKLTAAAKEMIQKFERLLVRILDPPGQGGGPAGGSLTCASPVAVGMQSYLKARDQGAGSDGDGAFVTIGQRLVEFDEAWLQYLDQFAAWKLEDAASLESELVRVAAEMERSLQRKLVRSASSGSPTGTTPRSARNLDSVVAQVRHDYELLRDRVERLSGAPGLARLDSAIRTVREQVALESASELETETQSELESASETESGSPSRQAARAAASANRAGPRPQSTPTPGLKRGFFSTPTTAAATPGTQQATPASATPVAASPGQDGVTPPFPQAAAAPASQRPPEVTVTDVRAPSVPRSPADASGPSSPRDAPSPLSPTPEGAAVAESIANLQMVWELVHNPGHRVNTLDAEAAWVRAISPADKPLAELDREELESLSPEQVAEQVREHARVLAESAFWTNVTGRIKAGLLSQSGMLLDTVVPLISELGKDLADVISHPQMRSSLLEEFSEASVREALGGAGAYPLVLLSPLAGRLQRLAGLLLSNGAPAREPEAKVAHEAMAKQLAAAMPAAAVALAAGGQQAAEAPAVAELAASIAKAFRVLLAQLKLLKLDAANGRLAALYQQVKGDGGVSYLRTKFAALHSLPTGWDSAAPQSGDAVTPAMAQRLPRTVAWLHRASAAAPGIQGYLASAGVDVNSAAVQEAAAEAAASAAVASSVPMNLRAGLRASGSAPASSGAAAAGSSGRQLPPSQLRTWQGLVRTGLIALVSSDKPAVGPALSETLAWDAERLHAAQNAFQQLVVVTAGMLLVQQTRARSGRPALAPADMAAARKRLMLVLADPSMSLTGLVSELYRLVTLGGPAPAAAAPAAPAEGAAAEPAGSDTVSEEATLAAAFRTLMNPTSAAYTSISNAIAGALSLHLLLGSAAVAADAGASGRGVVALLGRVGAGAVAEDVAGLAKQLAAVCVVSETVFAPVYERLARVE